MDLILLSITDSFIDFIMENENYLIGGVILTIIIYWYLGDKINNKFK